MAQQANCCLKIKVHIQMNFEWHAKKISKLFIAVPRAELLPFFLLLSIDLTLSSIMKPGSAMGKISKF